MSGKVQIDLVLSTQLVGYFHKHFNQYLPHELNIFLVNI